MHPFLIHLKSEVKIVRSFFLLACTAVVLVSCGASKPVAVNKNKPVPTKSVPKTSNLRTLESNYKGGVDIFVKDLLKDAEKYLGAPYKYGGNTSSGFDCSGFTTKVFAENSYKLPRRSEEQASFGKKIDISKVKPGDLLFFATSGGKKVSHVGIVHNVRSSGEVQFIHASTSKGVIISSLNEKYWNNAYLHAQTVL